MSYIAERRQEEKERRRADILDAAEAVAREVGWDALTMDQVARHARLSRALLYVYFKDKSDLMFGVSERGLDLLARRFDESLQRGRCGLEQMEGMGRAYVAFSHEFPVHFEAMARFEIHSPDVAQTDGSAGACLQCGGRVHELMVRAIENGMGDGSIRRDVGDPQVVSVALWGFMHGVIQLAATKAQVIGIHGVTAQALFQQALLMCGRSLGTPPTP